MEQIKGFFDKHALGIITAIVLLVVFIAIYFAMESTVAGSQFRLEFGNHKLAVSARECIKYGYPEYKFGTHEVYCIRLVNNSHQVVPLSELQNAK